MKNLFQISVGCLAVFLFLACANNVPLQQPDFSADEPKEVSTVSDGYTTTNSHNKTGASNSIEHSKTVLTLDTYLRGLAGVNVNGTGSSASVTVRGISSFQAGSNEPLFVVNGTPMSNYASTYVIINPNDIKRVTVLTDAASTGIYGSRGANGVIVITLKNAK